MTDTAAGIRRSSARQRPVFLLAPPRSYSTVTLAILAGHPDIFGFPEMLIFAAPTVGALLGEAQRIPSIDPGFFPRRHSGITRVVAELHEGNQRGDSIARAVTWLEEHADWPTVRFLDYLLGLIDPRIGLEKSPDTVKSKEALAECLANYPDARYLHLTREPVATQRSRLVQLRRLDQLRTGPPRSQRSLVVSAASAWYLGHCRIVGALNRLPVDQWMRIRAEDLLREPYIWLPQILRWLGLRCDKEIISDMLHTERWVFAGLGEAGNLFGGDPKFMLSPALRNVGEPEPVSFDPAWELPEEMQGLMIDLARFLGYK